MSKPKAIVFDCDEILLDWVAGFVKWHNQKYGTQVDAKSAYHKKLHTLFIDVETDTDTVSQRMKEFNSGTELSFRDLPSIHQALECMVNIQYHNNTLVEPVKFFVITKSGASADSSAMRIANLTNIFGDIFEHIYCLDIHESKVPYMQEIQANYDVVLFVDDYFENCKKITNECGVYSIALKCEHNKHMDSSKVNIVHDWETGIMPAIMQFITE